MDRGSHLRRLCVEGAAAFAGRGAVPGGGAPADGVIGFPRPPEPLAAERHRPHIRARRGRGHLGNLNDLRMSSTWALRSVGNSSIKMVSRVTGSTRISVSTVVPLLQ